MFKFGYDYFTLNETEAVMKTINLLVSDPVLALILGGILGLLAGSFI
jgi:hypothetical protein